MYKKIIENMCNCRNKIPSVYCSSCKELLCVVCDKDYLKCSSCSYFSCNKCNIKLLCNHNYCSIGCAIENNENKCDKKCFFFRDINSTDNTQYGLKNLLYYWINIELCDFPSQTSSPSEIVKKWLEDLNSIDNINNIDIKSKTKQLLQLL